MSTSIPSIPTPPIKRQWRSVIYAVWAWAALLLGALITGWESLGEAPKILYAVMLGLNFVGAGAGFMAKNNVSGK